MENEPPRHRRERLVFAPPPCQGGGRGRLILTLHFNRGSQRGKRTALRHDASSAVQTLWQRLSAGFARSSKSKVQSDWAESSRAATNSDFTQGRQFGTKFRRQYSVDAYVLDFYAPRVKLAIEVDGDSHFTASGREYDHLRTTYLRAFGIEVLRFTNMDILQNIEGVLTTIEAAVKRRTATSPLPPPW